MVAEAEACHELTMTEPTIVVAGATGRLGDRIVKALRAKNAKVVALTRANSNPEKVAALKLEGAEIATVDFKSVDSVAGACEGASCVVSAVLGMRETMIDGQSVLLDGAVKAGVPRFIPSDYALDYTKLAKGQNRNLDWHTEFLERVYKAPIAPTSIFNGAFMELLLGQAPFILFKLRRVIYWGSDTQPLDFTTMTNTAEFTACAALEAKTPKFLNCVGQRVTAQDLATIASEVTGQTFKTQWAGTTGMLGAMISGMKTVMPAPNDPFPPWQGMQYSKNMFEGRCLLSPIDNDRYAGIKWTQVKELLATRPAP